MSQPEKKVSWPQCFILLTIIANRSLYVDGFALAHVGITALELKLGHSSRGGEDMTLVKISATSLWIDGVARNVDGKCADAGTGQ